MNRLSQMHIAQKFILLVSSIAVLVTRDRTVFRLSARTKQDALHAGRPGKIIESQTQVTRAYIAKNYVSKIKGMKGLKESRFPRTICRILRAIPLPGDRDTGDE